MKSQNVFSTTARAEIPRSTFDLGHPYKTTFSGGSLVPFLVQEVLPGDTFKVRTNQYARFTTLLTPLMDNVYLTTFYFFVPNRLVWDNFQKFMGEQDDPGDSVDFTIPQMDMAGLAVPNLSIFDYFGIPTSGALDLEFSALPGRGFNLIYNTWFRDQNLQDSVVVNKGNGPDLIADYINYGADNEKLPRRGKRRDYLTGCLPFVQKGTAQPVLIGGTAPVLPAGDKIPQWKVADTGAEHRMQNVGSSGNQIEMEPNWTQAQDDMTWSQTKLEIDASSFTGNTINQLRQAFQIQKLLERDARGGTRYPEMIFSHFGVISDDARQNRPEYLGGGETMMNISAVPQTSQSDTSPQGHLAAYGIVSGSNGFMKSFTEHGYIIGIMSVRADLTYQEALHRMWSKKNKLDFYWPALAHIGEQAVLVKEIKAIGSLGSTDDDVWGYTGRFDEYRFQAGLITGQMRSNSPSPLDIWHASQSFDGAIPTLSAAFIEDNPPFDRLVATPSEPHFRYDSYIDISCTRPMPTFGTPGMIDHF